MKPVIYIETSIPSFYYESRKDIAAIARKQWTRTWWNNNQVTCQLVSSQAVLDELNAGDYPKKEQCLSLLDHIPLLVIEPEIGTIVQT